MLVHRRHMGPLSVQRPFYPEGGVCHVYLLHPPGGVVGGDRLSIDISAETGAQALITMPAAGKFYRSGGAEAGQQVTLRIAGQSSLEWLPQETIVYEGARLNAGMNIQLAKDAGFIGWEIVALGRPAAGEGFQSGHAHLAWRIDLDGQIFYLERQRLDAEAFAARWGLSRHSSFGTLFAYPSTAQQLEAVQELIGDHPGKGVTRIDQLLICRAIDQRADRLRDFFHAVWQSIRTDIIQKPACAPRIWAT